MTVEARCRAICIANKINPDADAPEVFQKMPGFQKTDGKVKQWQTWITTVTAQKQTRTNKFEQERKESCATLQRIIDETSRGAGQSTVVMRCKKEKE